MGSLLAALPQTNALIVVFAMDGCPACHDYLPRLEILVGEFNKFGHPILFYINGKTVHVGEIPIVVIDSTSSDTEVQALMDEHEIEALPTTLLQTRRYGDEKHQGALTDAQIHKLLVTSVERNR